MKCNLRYFIFVIALFISSFLFAPHSADAALTLTAGANATTTPNVATAITGFQIVGPAASTTPVKLFTTSGTLAMTTTTGLTFTGSPTGSVVYFSGTVANINAALSTLTYTRASTGTDTLEVSLVNSGEVFYTGNNHLYEFVAGSFTWSAAQTAAAARTSYGATGYLATITSAPENAFISARMTGDGWIGANDTAVEGTWKWITGPEANTTFWQGTGSGSTVGGNYANWNSGEPNQSGDEDCAETYVSSGQWNDLPCSATLGYVVEYGAPGNLPTVVAANVSIVTADVPAVTSLSPANSATGVSPTANLVIGFSKTVNANTGNISIRKTSDDSLVESIAVGSGLVTGGGTNTITINPATTLDEGTQYYVIVPSTAFRDGSSNPFAGITASTTWAFTTSDVTAPAITNVATSSVASTTATITWTTNELASTRVVYSTGNSFASTTTETDTSPRVTSHSVGLTGLVACTTYNFKVVSKDGFSNTATSSAYAFTTLGCIGETIPTNATSTSIAVNAAASSSLAQSGRSIVVTTPPNFTATSSTVIIQIRSMDSDPVLGVIGIPSGMSQATNIVFDVTALVNSTQVLDSFDTPVTITYTYTDDDVAGLDESSLVLYHYHGGAWLRLNDCSVNQSANTITCTAPSFSIFAIFGAPTVSASAIAPGSQSAIGSVMFGCKDPAASNYQSYVRHDASMCRYAAGISPASNPAGASADTSVDAPIGAYAFIRDLSLNMKGEDVRALQAFLNAKGFKVAASGAGSVGNETTLFGPATKAALIRYQKANGIKPAIGYFGPVTRAYVSSH